MKENKPLKPGLSSLCLIFFIFMAFPLRIDKMRCCRK